MFILTGFKIVLVTHLIFRGIWAGMVGLSYAFPQGINKKNLPATKQKVEYVKPQQFVIRLEKICSLLFSFVFASIASLILAIIFVLPLILLFIIRVDLTVIRMISNIYSVLLFVVAILFIFLVNTVFKNTKFKKMADNSFFEYIQKIYTTNLGRLKTYSLFIFGVSHFLTREY